MDDPAARAAQPLTGWTGRERVAALAAATVVMGAAYFAYSEYGDYRDHQELIDTRSEVLDLATEIAVGLATISPDTARQDIEALAERGTPEFASQVRSNLDAQVDLIATNDVSSVGEVSESGIVELIGDQATVAVALTSEVQNSATKNEPEERSYRMNVLLVKDEDGGWLTSEVVFVP